VAADSIEPSPHLPSTSTATATPSVMRLMRAAKLRQACLLHAIGNEVLPSRSL
jgi:hypothetical protein